MNSIFFASLKKLKKHVFNFLPAKKLKKLGYNFFQVEKNSKDTEIAVCDFMNSKIDLMNKIENFRLILVSDNLIS